MKHNATNQAELTIRNGPRIVPRITETKLVFIGKGFSMDWVPPGGNSYADSLELSAVTNFLNDNWATVLESDYSAIALYTRHAKPLTGVRSPWVCALVIRLTGHATGIYAEFASSEESIAEALSLAGI
jgi:hypothetical protein